MGGHGGGYCRLSRCLAVCYVLRAPALHAGGHWFESSTAHHQKALSPKGLHDMTLGGFSLLRGHVSDWWVSPRASRQWREDGLRD